MESGIGQRKAFGVLWIAGGAVALIAGLILIVWLAGDAPDFVAFADRVNRYWAPSDALAPIDRAIILFALFNPILWVATYHFYIARPRLKLAERTADVFMQYGANMERKADKLSAELQEAQRINRAFSLMVRAKARKDGAIPSYIYFIADTKTNMVKIGVSTTPEKRLAGLQTSSPNKLVFLAVAEGDEKKEKELHQQFKKYRKSGEWFELSTEIKQLIDALNSEFGQEYTPPEPEPEPLPPTRKVWRPVID
jgi:hypothetical protein